MRYRYAERKRSQGSSGFHIVEFTLTGVTAPGYRCAQAVAIISGSARGIHSLQQMIPDSQSVGHDRERGIHRAAGAEKAAIDNVEVVEFVRFAVTIERAGFRIVAKADRAVLMGDSGKRNTLAEEQITREQGLRGTRAREPSIRVCCCIRASSFLIRRLCPSSLFGLYCRTISPSRLIVTRLFGSGRSSDVSQKSSECLPIKSSVHFGATFGAPALRVSPSSLPTNEMCPMGNSQSGERR